MKPKEQSPPPGQRANLTFGVEVLEPTAFLKVREIRKKYQQDHDDLDVMYASYLEYDIKGIQVVDLGDGSPLGILAHVVEEEFERVRIVFFDCQDRLRDTGLLKLMHDVWASILPDNIKKITCPVLAEEEYLSDSLRLMGYKAKGVMRGKHIRRTKGVEYMIMGRMKEWAASTTTVTPSSENSVDLNEPVNSNGRTVECLENQVTTLITEPLATSQFETFRSIQDLDSQLNMESPSNSSPAGPSETQPPEKPPTA